MASPTKNDCDKWIKNPEINPLTGKKIVIDGPTYKRLQKKCNSYKKIVPSLSPKIETPKASSKEKILGAKKTKIKKADCEGQYKWIVGKGCFELIDKPTSPIKTFYKPIEKPISPAKSLKYVYKLGSKQAKIKKAECIYPDYEWVVGKGCFKRVKELDVPYVIPEGRKLSDLGYYKKDKFGKIIRDCPSLLSNDFIGIEKIEKENLLKYNDLHSSERLRHYVCKGLKPLYKDVQEWVDSNPRLVSASLSKDTYNWLQSYLNGTYMLKLDKFIIKPNILSELQQFRLNKPLRLFRGVHFNINNINILRSICLDELDINKWYYYTDDRPSSWTYNYTMAENFAKLGNFNLIFTAEINPEDILIDCRLLHYYCKMRGSSSSLQDEVILLPGKYKCQVVTPLPPFNKNNLFKAENLFGLEALYEFMYSNKEKLHPSFSGPKFGGNYGGLEGSYKINQNLKLLFNILLNDDTKNYELHYGYIGSEAMIEKLLQPKEKSGLFTKIKKMVGVKSSKLNLNSLFYYPSSQIPSMTLDKDCKGCDLIYRSEYYEYKNLQIIIFKDFNDLVHDFIHDIKELASL